MPSLSSSEMHEIIDSERDTFHTKINVFSGYYYKALAKTVVGNFVSSPMSVLMVLATMVYGADGNTKQELLDTLQLSFDNKSVASTLYDFMQNLNNTKTVDVHLANELFIASQLSVKPPFVERMETLFQSKIVRTNFSDVDKAARKINNWVKKNANNKVIDIVQPGDLTGVLCMLVNAVYFKGDWVDTFTKPLEDSVFHISKSYSVSVPTMCHGSLLLSHGPVLNNMAEYIELPYENNDRKNEFSMYIILPDEKTTVNVVGDNIYKINFAELTFPVELIDFCMPKFTIENRLSLKPVLQKMGINDLFGNNANLSNLTTENNFKVSDVMQTAFLNVDRKGTEATDASDILAESSIYSKSIHIDRPFIAAIVSKISGTPLFWARVMDPRPL